MTLLRLVRSFGARRGLVLWLLPEIRRSLDDEYQPKVKWTYYPLVGSGSTTYTVPPNTTVTYTNT